MKFIIFLACLTTMIQLNECKVKQCKLCTSDDGGNMGCEETPELQISGECDPQYGDDYCYVLYTRNKKPTPGETWNRGCCSPKAGVNTCPIDKPNHENNEYYEMWRVKCDTDNCNIMDPRTYNDGGNNNDGGVIVHGKSSASHHPIRLPSFILAILTICIVLF